MPFFQEIINEAPYGVLATDHEGNPVFANKAFRRRFGLKSAGDVFDYPGKAHVIEAVASGRTITVEMKTGTGETAAVHFFSTKSSDGRLWGLALSINRIEIDVPVDGVGRADGDELVLEALLSSSHDGLWLMDHHGTVIRINRGAERIHRLKKEQVVGKTIGELLDMKVIDRSITTEVFRHKTSLTIVQKLPRIDKEILTTATPVFDRTGELKFVVVVDRDMTELSRLRRELDEMRDSGVTSSNRMTTGLDSDSPAHDGIVVSRAMKRVFKRAMRAAGTDSTLLITGESGVGKGFIVKHIHQASERKKGPLVHLDCGAVPETLVDSELFGHERGAFTGARREGKAGYLEAADGGTLFLDEISELPQSAQVKLLRFLDSQEFIRVGGTKVRHSNARILAATNRNLEDMVKEGTFRKDLFFRLNVIPLWIPPLKDRTEALPKLISHFLELLNEKNRTDKRFDTQATGYLCRYHYPGNIRELINLIEQLVVLSPDSTITADDLPRHIRQEASPLETWTGDKGWDMRRAVAELERQMIVKAIKRFGSQRKAAGYLGIDQSTLARKARKHGIRWELIIHDEQRD